MADAHVANNIKKRKKKRSKIQMAKKFARQRNRGTDIDSDVYQYMIRVLELMKNGFPSFKEKLLFVNNVYKETIGHEIEFAQNQVGSRILDSLLKYANFETIQRLVDAFGSSLRPLSSDKFASHVLQNIVMVCANRGNKRPPLKLGSEEHAPSESGSDEYESSESDMEANTDAIVEAKQSRIDSYNGIVLKLSRYFINNIEEFVFDTYANHLLRTVIECLGGLIGRSKDKQKKDAILKKRRPVIQEYKDLLLHTCNRLHKWPQFLEFGKDALTSGLLQSILYSLKDINSETTEMYIHKITNELFKPGNDQQLSDIFDEECSVRLLEASLVVAEPETLYKIYEEFFMGKLMQLSLMPKANFSVQRLLDHWTMKEEFEKVFGELSAGISEVHRKCHTGILSSLANACLRLQTKQGAFVTELLKGYQCETSERQNRVIACIISLQTWEKLEDLKKEKGLYFSSCVHGSLIIEAILNFNKPIKLVNSLLETNEDELIHLFNDQKGCHVVDAFMNSKYIGEKSREKLAKKLKGRWTELATDIYGSRSLETIWRWAGTNQKMLIMEELAEVGESLRSTKCGQIISNKLNVPLFARNKNDWMEAQGKEGKTKTLFANIIGNAAKKKKTS